MKNKDTKTIELTFADLEFINLGLRLLDEDLKERAKSMPSGCWGINPDAEYREAAAELKKKISSLFEELYKEIDARGEVPGLHTQRG